MKKRLFFVLALICIALTANAKIFSGDTRYLSFQLNDYTHEAIVLGEKEGVTNTTLYIPPSVTYQETEYSVISISSGAFNGCSKLTSVTIPNSVRFIGQNAFNGCSGLTNIFSAIEKPFAFGVNAFKGVASTCTLTVPAETKDAYIAQGWTTDVFGGGIKSMVSSLSFTQPKRGLAMKSSSTLQLNPTISPSTVNKDELIWSSSNSNIATVSSAGLVTGKEEGTVTITCESVNSSGETVSASCEVSVFNSALVNNLSFTQPKRGLAMKSSSTLQLNPTISPSTVNKDELIWSSSNSNIATVSSEGLVTGKEEGTVTITCKGVNSSGETVSASCEVFVFNGKKLDINNISFVSPTEVLEEKEKGINTTLQLTPTISPSTISNNDLTWSSSDEEIATVSKSGLVTGKDYGTATITCSAVNQQGELVSASCRVIVYKEELIYVGNIFYDIKGGGAKVTNCAGGIPSNVNKDGYEYSGTVNVPPSVTYDGVNYPVKAIGTYAFYNQPELQAVQIPSSVLTFEPSAFEKSKNLARVLFSSKDAGLISVGERAFYECSKLNNVVLPNSTQRIDKEGFRYCSSLSNITLSNSLNYINEYAFADCPVLNNVVLPESLKSIQNAAFNNDAALSSITFPAALEGIGASAFANCASLKEVTFNTTNYTMTIGADAFKGSNAINKVKVAHLDSWVSINFKNPEANPASISHRLYSTGGSEIIDAEVPEGPSYVNNNVFYNCQNLKSVTLPSSIQIINDNIFYGCTSLTKVVSKATNPPYFAGVDDPTKMNNVFNAADLYVPDASVSSYSSDDWWKRFKKTKKMSDMQNQPGSIEPAYKVGDDIVSLATAEWEGKTADYGGLANPAVERYTNAAPDETGDILTQTLTGLRNGTYKVQLEVAASFTPDRGFTCPTGNGLSVAFANEAQENLPVVERGWVSEGEQNTVTLTATVTDGTLKYGIKNLAPSGNWFVARVSSIVYVSGSGDEPNYKAGDANGDGSVNVFDVTAIVNYILGSPSGTFVSKAADVNNDGNVNVFDVTKVVNIILGVNAGAKMRGVIDMNEGSAVITSTGEKNKDLVVNDAERYVAMQFDVVVQENSTLQNVALNNTAGHSLAYRQVEANRYRVIAYSTQNSTFEPTEEALVSLSFSDGNEAEIENAQFITANGHSIFMVVADEATNIVEVEGDIDEDVIYNMAGQYVGNNKKTLPKGIYICNGKKFVVQ